MSTILAGDPLTGQLLLGVSEGEFVGADELIVMVFVDVLSVGATFAKPGLGPEVSVGTWVATEFEWDEVVLFVVFEKLAFGELFMFEGVGIGEWWTNGLGPAL